ncbi:MAG: ribonucleotide reductase subunit alpha [Halopseudomonas yangmingensis]|uniref:Uncharacterized protein n=1 Tax=Halopseudomonas yangmingensis TaxID=1720063 RepID=A0A1I4NL57_9GAMM|nr:hypothetical protein [Halopseudomonas yangmingensis]SFM16272.1 hypothetical protein SAMN05216217_101399 [Halopseudomonas yangmingensis]
MQEPSIQSFSDLLAVARQQSEPQRLLFVFARPELPEGHTAEQAKRFAEGQGGHLAPVLCVDKSANELGSFDELVAESETTGQEWAVVFVAALSGQMGCEAAPESCDKALRNMVSSIQVGRVAGFLTFDRSGAPMELITG